MKLKYCKYIFTFQNEYWDDFDFELREILGISEEKNHGKIYDDKEKGFAVQEICESGIGGVYFSEYYNVYYVVKAAIFVQEKDAPRVEALLHKYREIIYEDYGEDHMKEIKLRDKEEFRYLEEADREMLFDHDPKEFLE